MDDKDYEVALKYKGNRTWKQVLMGEQNEEEN